MTRRALTAAARRLLTADTEMAVYRESVELLGEALPAEKCKVATIEDDAVVIQVETTNGIDTPGRRVPLNDDELEIAIRRREPFAFEDLADVRGASDAPETPAPEYRSLIGVPFGETQLLIAAAADPGAFTAAHLATADILATFVEARLADLPAEPAGPENGELLAEVASILSHDLKSPLSIASGNLELVRQTTEAEKLDTVAAALNRLETMLDDLVTLARTGDRVDPTDRVDLAAVAESAWTMVEADGAALTVEGSATFQADRGQLYQVFENLFRNAIGHVGPTVSIRVGVLDNRTGIYIEDDGPGIPPGRRPHVFEFGYSSTAEQTGFGLAIVRRIVEAHGWDISVLEGADGGARFEVTGLSLEPAA